MAERSPKRRFGMSISNSVLEILIYEDIGATWWGDGGITTSTISAKLKSVGAYDSISVRINSVGGDCFEGIGIYNLLRAQGKPISVSVDGLAASAASIIAMAGDTINVGTGAMLMIHNAAVFAYGEAAELRKVADTLDSISVTAGEIYVKRTGQSAAKIKEMMDAETWLNGAEAVELGFATAVVELDDDEDATAQALAREMAAAAMTAGVFRHVPRAVAAAVRPSVVARGGARAIQQPRQDAGDDSECTCPCAPCVDGDCDGCESDPCTYAGCDCPQHEEMAAVDPARLKYYQHRLAYLSRR